MKRNKYIRNIISLCLGCIMFMINTSSIMASEKNLEGNLQESNYVLYGETENASEYVTAILLRKKAVDNNNVTSSDIGFATEIKSNKNKKYYLKFKFGENPNDYYISVRNGKNDISDKIITAKESDVNPIELKLDICDKLQGELQIGLDSEAVLRAEIKNKFGDKSTFTLVFAQYDKDGALIKTDISRNNSISYQSDGISEIIKENLVLESGIAQVKAFAFKDLSTLTPICNSVGKTQSESLGYNNLIDTDGTGEINIVYMGGSITEGSYLPSADQRWVNIVSDKFFKKKYPNKTINYYNAGISATGSDYGELRIQNHVRVHNPDIVFVEFAINDGTPDASDKKHMESIVRQMLKFPKQPVIIFLYTAGQKQEYGLGNNATEAQKNHSSDVPNAKTAHEEVAQYYGISSIDLDAYIESLLTDKTNTKLQNWDDFSGDTVHPNVYGNKLYADYIMNCLNNEFNKHIKILDKSKNSEFGADINNVKLIDCNNERIKYSGEYNFDYVLNELIGKPTDIGGGEFGHIDVNDYTEVYKNWRYYNNLSSNMKAGAQFTFNFTGHKIGLLGFKNTKGLKAKYTIDEGTAKERTGIMGDDFFWKRLHQLMYTDNLDDGEHTLKVEVLNEHNGAYNPSEDSQKAYNNYFVFGYLLVDEK